VLSGFQQRRAAEQARQILDQLIDAVAALTLVAIAQILSRTKGPNGLVGSRH